MLPQKAYTVVLSTFGIEVAQLPQPAHQLHCCSNPVQSLVENHPTERALLLLAFVHT